MAVYTSLDNASLEAFLALHYPALQLVSITPIAEGVTNSNFLIEVIDQGLPNKMILTLIEDPTLNLDDLELIFNWQHFLRDKKQLPIPAPMQGNSDQDWHELKGRPAILVPFFQGNHIQSPDVEHVQAIAELLGEFHSPEAASFMTRQNPHGVDHWQQLIKHELAGSPFFSELKYALSRIPEGLLAGYSGPVRSLHADLFRDNILWQGDRVSGVLDFFYACSGSPLYEVFICLNEWCWPDDKPEPGQHLIDAFLTSYPHYFDTSSVSDIQLFAEAASFRFWISRSLSELQSGKIHPDKPAEAAYKKWQFWHDQVSLKLRSNIQKLISV